MCITAMGLKRSSKNSRTITNLRSSMDAVHWKKATSGPVRFVSASFVCTSLRWRCPLVTRLVISIATWYSQRAIHGWHLRTSKGVEGNAQELIKWLR